MNKRQKSDLFRCIISGILFTAGFFVPGETLQISIFLLAYLCVGLEVIQKAITNIFRGQIFDENFLMAVATFGALAIGEYHEAVAVMLLYQIGELFQSYAVHKSRKSIASLMDIRPDTADVERKGQIETVSPESVLVDEVIVVKAGARVPLDGIVIEGMSSLDTAALTGESLPRDVDEIGRAHV